MINNTSQHNVATWFRCGGMFDSTLLQIYCRVCFERNF